MNFFKRFTVAFAQAKATTPKPQAPQLPATGAKAVDQSPAGDITSIERPQFGAYGAQFARQNLDTLAAKQTLGIYKRMRIDEQVKAACTFKRDAIVSRGWTFEYPEDSELPQAEQELRCRVFCKVVDGLDIGFVDALNVISVGRELGYSLTEKVYGKVDVDKKQYVGLEALLGRDPATFDFYTDEFGRLLRVEQVAGGKRINIDLGKFVHYVHNPEFDVYFGQSDLREAYRSWYFKEVILRYWALYMEKFAGGMLIAQLTQESQIAFGSAAYDALVSTLASVKASPSVLMPIGVTATVQFPTTTDAYEKACTWHDLQIAKALLVPNLAGVSHTGETGSYSQAQTQLESFAWTLQADTKRLESCVDKQLFRDLGEQNWGDGQYPCFKFKPMSDAKMQWLIDTWSKLAGAGVVVPTEADEARLREILEMPPRDDKDKPLADPAAEAAQANSADTAAAATDQGHRNAKDLATHQHDLGEQAKDNDIERQAQAAAAAEPDPKKKRQAYARARYAATVRMGFDPDQERDDHGRWTGNGAGGVTSEVGKRAHSIEGKVSNGVAAGEKAYGRAKNQAQRSKIQRAIDAYHSAREALDDLHRAERSGAPDKEVKSLAQQAEGAYVNASELASKANFSAVSMGYDPDEPRDERGRWGDGALKQVHSSVGAVEDLYDNQDFLAGGFKDRAERASVSSSKALKSNSAADHRAAQLAHEEAAHSLRSGARAAQPTYSGTMNSLALAHEVAARDHRDASNARGRMSAPTLRDAKVVAASARERVDFAVIDRKAADISAACAADVAGVIARNARGLLGTDADVAKLTDSDVSDIANVELPGIARGKIKTYFVRALTEGAALGRRQAQQELRREGRSFVRTAAHFADLRENAAGYFEANGFRMAGNASDGAKAIIQQELLSSVRNGRSPTQTRTAIWERLVAKGFSSREAVRGVETDAAVNDALDALWVDSEAQAASYLDTLARTNIFQSMNEARYAEFTDPALDGFVAAFRYSAVLDDRTTDICEALDDHVWKSDSPLWDTYRPPNHYNCRSLLVPITQVDVEDGLWDGAEDDQPSVEPQAGFGS